MRHFLPKRTSSSFDFSRPRPAPTQQTAKPTPTTPEPRPPEGRRDRGRSRSARCYRFPKRKGPWPKISLDLAPQKSSWSDRQKEEGPESHYSWTTPQAASNVPLDTSFNAKGRGKCVFGSSRDHYSAQVSGRCESRQNKTHTFSKREQKSFSAYHKHPALMEQVCTTVSTPCHAGRGLAGHPQCVSVGNDYGKTRLYSSIRSKTTALVLATTVCSEDAHVLRTEVMNLLEKMSHRYRSSSSERVRLLQPLLPRPQKRRQPATYSRSQTPELRPDEKFAQDDHFETDPLANMPRGLVHVTGSERRVLSHPGSPPSQTILEIRIQRCGISIQGPAIWAVPGSPHFYTMHGCGSLPVCDIGESVYATTSMTGSFWPSRRRF